MKIESPWPQEIVDALNRFQNLPGVHPFTCGNRDTEAHKQYQTAHGGDFGQLVATADGWICLSCDYRQNWAHHFMVEFGNIFTKHKSNPLPSSEQALLLADICPLCNAAPLTPGPQGGLSQDVLCPACHTEYCRSPIMSEIIHRPCPPQRLLQVYGIA